MSMRVVVAGVPGAGKTSIMEAVAKEIRYTIVNYGSVMFEIARLRELVEHRDDMRKLPVSVQKELQKEAASKIGRMKDVIVDTHLTIKTPSGYLPGLPIWVLNEINPDLIVVVEAKPHEILRRRRTDTSRHRDFETQEDIKEHMDANRYAAFACSVLTGAPVMILTNRDGMLEESVERFMEAFK